MCILLIADSRRFVRTGLSVMFSDLEIIEGVVEVTSTDELLRSIEKVSVDFALIHQSLFTGHAAFQRIPAVVYTSEPSLHMLYMVYRNNGRGYITENASCEFLLMLLSLQKDTFLLDPAIACQLLHLTSHQQMIPAQTELLTEREHEIFELLTKGQTNNEISHQLCISLTTVKKHVANISQKLNMKRRPMKMFAHS